MDRRGLEALVDVSRELVGELDLDRLLGLVVAQAVRLAGDLAAIYLLEDGHLIARTRSHAHVLAEPIPVGVGVTGRCAARREPVVVNDYAEWPEALPAAVAAGGRHIAAQPLLV